MGAFLFTMKSFVIQTMKRELFDLPDYKLEIAQRRSEGKKKEEYYGPLNRLRCLMTWAIVVAFLNAAINVFLGNTTSPAVAWLCIGSSALSWSLVIGCLYFVSTNLGIMIDRSEKNAVELEASILEAAQKKALQEIVEGEENNAREQSSK
jgi:hypothetical protein